MKKGQLSFFAVEEQLEKIYANNGFFPKLNTLVDWEMFREELTRVRKQERKSNAGQKGFDVVLMFKILVLKSLYNLSDDKTEEQIRQYDVASGRLPTTSLWSLPLANRTKRA